MIELYSFNTGELIIIFIIIMGAYILLKELYMYMSNYHGKLLIQAEERKSLAILWTVLIVMCILLLTNDIREYMKYNELIYRTNILLHILWIEVSILNILGAITHSQIREKGIYISFHFFKWSKIKSYEWILPDIVEVRVAILYKMSLKFKLILDRASDRPQVDEILQKYIIVS